jgi:hypothetical protein
MDDRDVQERLSSSLQAFRRVLSLGWAEVEAAQARSGEPFLTDDWAQSTWELLVERAFPAEARIFLEPYGAGADCNGASSRITFPEAQPTHGVFCFARSGAAVRDLLSGQPLELPAGGVLLDEFVTWDGRWYQRASPFDSARMPLQGGREAVVPLEDVRFELRAVAPSGGVSRSGPRTRPG